MDVMPFLSIPTMILITTSGTIGNILIIRYYGTSTSRYRKAAEACQNKQQPRRRKTFHAFLVHLAVTDLTACLFIPLYYIPQEINGRWYYGRFLCRYTVFIPTGVTIYTSCWILLGIIYERYRSIVHPFKPKTTTALIHLFCAGAWMLSVAVHIPYFMSIEYKRAENKTHFVCVNKIVERLPPNIVLLYYVLRLVLQCILPVAVMIFFYSRIQRILDRSNRFVKAFTTTNYANTDKVSVNSSVEQHTKSNKAVLKALRVSLLIFAVTAMLNNTAHVVKAVLRLYFPRFWEGNRSLQICVEICIRLLAFNNTVNCFVYAGNMKDFKNYILYLFWSKRSRRRIWSIASTRSKTDSIDRCRKEKNVNTVRVK